MKARLNIPNQLSEISLRKYQKFVKLNTEEVDDRFLQVKMIEIFCDISHESVLKIKFSDADRVTAILGEMFSQKPNLVTKFQLNGIEYGFIPELDEISFGEYIDLDTYLGDWENIQTAMNVLYRPIKSRKGDRYIISDYNVNTKDELLDMPLDAVISSVFFFYHLGKDLSVVMNRYLAKELKRARPLELEDLMQSGDGIKQFSHSLQGILEDLKISLN
jgi:hypothetical protein|tara:strand:+ start:2410 stop:3063 length:654 start_codon:yes stop_codon:yes gene_type:complete